MLLVNDQIRRGALRFRVQGGPSTWGKSAGIRDLQALAEDNTDDHMRNHGLLRAGKGWRLSPSFEVNPVPSGVSETPLTPGGSLWDRYVRDLIDYALEFRLMRE
ncbi:hypothetical protein QK285_17740 [Pseudarthrobacter sp. AL20]|uniref:hypothetical protein n=1 Tax=Pseudarthrobacter sp. AL20 TaxID=3042239 RepID=UPI00249B233F|nr:hypothetical protein [Pseudarthrobacter sp. AL20]MDI3196233.1 hypothetical protein [Pseudarthrobacter sp. AL20]